MRKKLMALALTFAMVNGLLTGCAGSTASGTDADRENAGTTEKSETAPTSQTIEVNADEFDYSAWTDEQGRTVITICSPADPGTFDPLQTYSQDALQCTLFESLFYVDPETWEIKPNMAKDYEMSDDGLQAKVEIYDYIYDTAGNQITSNDIKYCYDASKERGAANSSGIDHIEIIDDYNFIMHLSSSRVGIWTNTSAFKIFSQKSYEEAENFGTNPIATGPYVLEEWVPGSSYRFVKNDNYWQKDPALTATICKQNVDAVEFKVIKEPAQQSIALGLGNVDIVNAMSFTETSRFLPGGENEGTHNVYTYDSILAQLLYLNMAEGSVFADDPELRKAVFHSISREDLIDGSADGYGNLCYTFGCEAGSLGFLQKWYEEEYYPYDVEYAKKCLDQSNYDGTSIRIVSNNSDMKKAEGQLIQMLLQSAGINAEVVTYEDALFNTYKNDPTQWDILLDNTSAGAELCSMWRRKFDPNNFSNDQGGANFMHDDGLNEILYQCIDMATYSDETVDAYHQALKERYSAMGLFNALCFDVCSKVVTHTAVTDSGHLLANCCTYIWNEKQ